MSIDYLLGYQNGRFNICFAFKNLLKECHICDYFMSNTIKGKLTTNKHKVSKFYSNHI
jgi:hypothetical protein